MAHGVLQNEIVLVGVFEFRKLAAAQHKVSHLILSPMQRKTHSSIAALSSQHKSRG
jgi:hypothetical protein